ncbi:MAG: hypothetical protein KAU27_09990 [Desulfuromonadales bacterium]|nr:hypothetical protein [Desulfuromonadales bacterium]
METKKSLRTFFILLIIWFVTITTVIIGSIVYDRYQASEYSDTAVPYVEKIIPIVSTWEPKAIRELMVPEVSAEISEDKFAQTMALFSKLGALQSMEEPQFEDVDTGGKTVIGMQTILEYKIDAQYENGEALLNIKLLSRDGVFELYSFNVGSEVLLD